MISHSLTPSTSWERNHLQLVDVHGLKKSASSFRWDQTPSQSFERPELWIEGKNWWSDMEWYHGLNGNQNRKIIRKRWSCAGVFWKLWLTKKLIYQSHDLDMLFYPWCWNSWWFFFCHVSAWTRIREIATSNSTVNTISTATRTESFGP